MPLPFISGRMSRGGALASATASGGGGGSDNTYSVLFDGSNETAKSGGSLSCNSMSLWFKPDSAFTYASTPQVLLGVSLSGDGIYIGQAGGYAKGLSNALLFFSGGAGVYWAYSTTSTLTASWHHVVCAFSSSSTTNPGNAGYDIYLDGTKVGNSFDTFYPGAGSVQTSQNTIVQGNHARTDGGQGGQLFDGHLDELAIWDANLSSADVTAIYNSGVPNDLTEAGSYDTDRTGNLIGYWRNGDGTEGASGTTIFDMSTNSNNMLMINGPSFVEDVPS